MPTKNLMESLSRQYQTLNNLILEAEQSQDQEESIRLFYKAQIETDKLSNSLKRSLESENQNQKLNAA